MAQAIKLTQEQQACVDYQGITAKNLVIQGVAGSGKSTVLMARANKYLTKEYVPGRSNQVIIFTYNNTLASYIQELFEIDESKKSYVRIVTLDSFLSEVYKYTPGSHRKRPIDARFRKKYMQQALDNHKSNYGEHRLHSAGVDFWIEECQWMRDMNIAAPDFEFYRTLPRKGRGGKVKIFDADRKVAFQIYMAYKEELDKKYLCEFDDWYLFLSHRLSSIPDRYKYDHVLIDEAQDQSLTKMLVVAALCRKDATISMDMNQRIYKQNWTMKQLGLPSITKTLKYGFRCSPENQELAADLLSHNPDADIEMAPAMCEHGPLPIIKKVANEYDTKRALVETLRDWAQQDPSATVGVLGATNKLSEKYGAWLTDAGLCYELIKPSERFSVEKSGIKLSTLHSAKGLEFTHVIIPDFNEDVLPWLPKTDDAEIINDYLAQGRNLAYVGMTRAKKQLLILCEQRASRFVKEMNPKLYQAIGFGLSSKPTTSGQTEQVKPAAPKEMIVENRDVVTAVPTGGGKVGRFHIDTKHYPAHQAIIGKKVGDTFEIGGTTYKIAKIEGPQLGQKPEPPKPISKPSDPNAGKTPEQIKMENANTSSLRDFFVSCGFKVVDKRMLNGALWVIGDKASLEPFVRRAYVLFGASGNYGSGRSSYYQPAWWTKSGK